MNRSHYFNYIEKKLTFLAYQIEVRGQINLLDLHIYSETFFAELMNHLLGYNLKNINALQQNMEGIDLVDDENKIIVQVSSTCSKQKIKSSLSKKILQDYLGYSFKFIAISKNADNLRKKTFDNPYNISFLPSDDIYDVNSLLNIILNMSILEQQSLYTFIKNELGNKPDDIVKVDSNLATIINILSQEDLSNMIDFPEINSFEIIKKIEFNKLLAVEYTINDYKIYYGRLDTMYKEFDKQGANKSLSVLLAIRKQYIKLREENLEPHTMFYSIITNLMDFIKNSNNYSPIPDEELEMCVSILVVDAFIRCKIFENPEGYKHVTT